MALELAVAFIRVKVNRTLLNQEMSKTRGVIKKGIGTVNVNVRVNRKNLGQEINAIRKRISAGLKGIPATVHLNRGTGQASGFAGGGVSQRGASGGSASGGQGGRGGGLVPMGRRVGGAPDRPGGKGRYGGLVGSGVSGFGAGAVFGMSPGLAVAGSFGGAPGAAGYLGAKGLATSIKEFADFEHAFRRVQIIQRESGADSGEIQKLQDQARELGRTTVFSALEAAQAMVVLTQKGFDANEVYRQMPNVLNLAAAGQMGIADAAGVVASAQKQFGKDAKETQNIVDILAKAALNSSTDIGELGVALSYVGAIASVSGKGLEETTSALMVLRDAGMEASRAGTGLARILTKLSTSKVDGKFQAIGVTTRDVNGSLRSLADIIEDTDKAMEGMSDTGRLAFNIDAFGQRGGPAFASLMQQGADALRTNTELLKGYGGTAQRVASESFKTLKGASILLKDALSDVAISMGGAFGPSVTQMLYDVAKALGVIRLGVVDINKEIDKGGFAWPWTVYAGYAEVERVKRENEEKEKKQKQEQRDQQGSDDPNQRKIARDRIRDRTERLKKALDGHFGMTYNPGTGELTEPTFPQKGRYNYKDIDKAKKYLEEIKQLEADAARMDKEQGQEEANAKRRKVHKARAEKFKGMTDDQLDWRSKKRFFDSEDAREEKFVKEEKERRKKVADADLEKATDEVLAKRGFEKSFRGKASPGFVEGWLGVVQEGGAEGFIEELNKLRYTKGESELDEATKRSLRGSRELKRIKERADAREDYSKRRKEHKSGYLDRLAKHKAAAPELKEIRRRRQEEIEDVMDTFSDPLKIIKDASDDVGFRRFIGDLRGGTGTARSDLLGGAMAIGGMFAPSLLSGEIVKGEKKKGNGFQSQRFGIEEFSNQIQQSVLSKDPIQDQIASNTEKTAGNTEKMATALENLGDGEARFA